MNPVAWRWPKKSPIIQPFEITQDDAKARAAMSRGEPVEPLYTLTAPDSRSSGQVEPTHRQFRLQWEAAARPPVHPEVMTGRQMFSTFEQALNFMRKQPADSTFVSMIQIEGYSRDRTDEFRAALTRSGEKSE